MAPPVPFVLKPDTAYMEVPRCDRCRWWECSADPHNGRCRLFSSDGEVRHVHRIDRRAIVASNYDEPAIPGTEFLTQASFGCVQWEARSS